MERLAKQSLEAQKKEDPPTFNSSPEEWILRAASTLKPEEREFVVDSGANMHMVSKKDFDKAELETVRVSKNPTVVMTANGEVLAREEATVHVCELGLFVTVVLLENTEAVLSLGKLCEEFGYSYGWTSGQNHVSSKMARNFINFIATHQIMYHSSYLVYQRVPLPHLLRLHLHRRKP